MIIMRKKAKLGCLTSTGQTQNMARSTVFTLLYEEVASQLYSFASNSMHCNILYFIIESVKADE